ncbi:MAG: alpha/beta fold hydrolase [Proteobacteria bacterium]|nr:MAG: alpha/beta fold hydrolase [Pseudomonadota bacterium]
MSYETEFSLPRLGDGDGGGRIVDWLKQPGDSFVKDETVLEVETDKAVVEVPAPADGKLIAHVAAVDDLVDYQDPLARVEFAGEPPEETVPEDATEGPGAAANIALQQSEPRDHADIEPDSAAESATEHGDRVIASPFARKLASERGIGLAGVRGTGKGGRVVAADVPQRGAAFATSTSNTVASGKSEIREEFVKISTGRVFMRFIEPRVRRVESTLLLLHGLFGDVDTWTGNATMLARQGIAVAAFDLPAHGKSECAADSFDGVVAAVAEAARSAIAGPISLVGHSFGGAVAARLSRTPGLAISGLTLIAPVGIGTEINQSFIDGMIRARTCEALEREMRKLTVKAQSPGSAYVEALRRRIEFNAPQLERLCQDVFHHGVQQVDIVPDLVDTGVVTRLVAGRSDVIVPWKHALNAPPRVALHLVPEAGHMPQWEASAMVTELIASSCA